MAVNKVIYNTENGAETLIDLTTDSVTPETLAKGTVAHDASGNVITGTMKTVDELLENVTANDTLVWDGNTEGKTVFDMTGDGTYTYYPVSENVLSLDDLSNGLILESSDLNGNAFESMLLTDFAMMSSKIIASRTVSSVLFVLEDNAPLYSGTIPKKGIYFMHSKEFGYVSRIQIEGYTGFNSEVEVLKKKYLPDHTHDWDDLTDDCKTEINEYIADALSEAKASGEFDGKDGDDGKTPMKGVDYYTEADKAEWSEYIASELAKRGQLAPEYAESLEWLEANGDQSKMYVLPDGMIYAWMLTEVESGPSYTNILPLAVNADGTPYVGNNGEKGYKTDWRLNSSKAEVQESGMCCTGFMPITPSGATGTLRLKNITPTGTKGGYLYAFGSDRSTSKGADSSIVSRLNNAYDASTGIYTLNIGKGYDNSFGLLSEAHYLRLSIGNINENTIITWNEEITESGGISTGYAWASTGHAFVPADYEDRIIAVEDRAFSNTKKIAELEKAVENGGDGDATEKDAYNRIKNWKYPIHEDAPVFLLETDKPAIASTDTNTNAVYAKYDTLMSANSQYISRVNCGMASDGTTPIYVYHFKEPEPHYNGTWSETKPVILVVSGVHPTEQSGVWSMYYAMEEITNNKKLLDLRRNLHIIVMPMINPTGFTDSTYGVRNPDGIQVHYNFEVDFKYPTDSGYVAHGQRNHGGETPLSIPETQYFAAIMEEYKDTLACVLSCHNNDVDTQWGTGFVWSSCATHFMCNLGFRLVDKLSAAWREKYGTAFDEGVRWANNYALTKKAEGSSLFPNAVEQAEWDFRVGRASISGSGGTEYKQALKYGVHGINVEVCDRCMVIDKDFTKTRTAAVTTMGCETYVNFFRTFMAAYDPKDKKDYAPNLPWKG